MGSLKTIQVLAKIGKIMSKIVYICCIVGFCGCIAGMLSLAVGAEALKLGGVTLHSIIQSKANLSVNSLYATMAVGMLLCAGEGVLAKFAEHYFARELADGTPFDFGGAKELFRLGVLTISIPLGTMLIGEIVYAILAELYADIAPLELKGYDAVWLGAVFMIVSALCRHGAELKDGK